MSTVHAVVALFVLESLLFVPVVTAQGLAGPSGPLTCHKVVCPLPAAPCWVRASDRCVTGGGPPQCPAIIPAPTGTACNDGNVCTGTAPIPSQSGDVCNAGSCGGTPLTCTSSTDTCGPSSGCATACDATGCNVSAGGAGSATLTIPPGALSGPVRISIVDLGPDPNNSSVYHVYGLAPSGTTFSSPATIYLPAPTVDSTHTVVIDVSEDSGVTWTEIPSTLSGGRVTGPISHFSLCRSRVSAILLTKGLIMIDMVQWFDAASSLNPGGIAFPGCNPTDYFGICFSFKNPSLTQPVTTAQVRIAPWQCYGATHDITNTPPGDHCDFTGLLIPCTPADITLTLPAGGIPPGGTGNAEINLAGTFASCLGSSFVGVDALFREPSTTDLAAGIRSARDGPLVCTDASCTTRTLFQGIYPLKKFNPSGKLIEDFLIDTKF